jgi:allene oxide cyclase
MKRVLVPALAAAAAVLVFAVVNASAGHAKAQHHNPGHSRTHGGGTIHVVEHATTDAVTNGKAGDSAGNILTFANDVFDSADATKVGSDQGSCVRTVVGKAWECMWTTFLPAGQITVEGPFYDAADSTVAITGGTGAYRNVRGLMDLKYRNPAGTEFDFVFHLIG